MARAMHIRAALRGDLREIMARDTARLGRAIGGSVGETTTTLKDAARVEVRRVFGRTRAGRGARRVSNTIRGRLFEDGEIGRTGLVFSKFGRRQGGEFQDFFLPFVRGATIRPKRARFLYIPLGPRTRRSRARRFTVENTRNLRFIPLDRSRTLIVRQTRTRSTPIALLVRQVRITPRLNFDRLVQRERAKLPRRLLAGLDAQGFGTR